MAEETFIVLVNYQARAPYPSEISGFKPGTVMIGRRVLSGSDLPTGSHWVVKDIDKNNNVTFYPLSARGLNSERSHPLTGIVPYAAQGLHTTKSYFWPRPLYTNANI